MYVSYVHVCTLKGGGRGGRVDWIYLYGTWKTHTLSLHASFCEVDRTTPTGFDKLCINCTVEAYVRATWKDQGGLYV
jgi:hypothetical protein